MTFNEKDMEIAGATGRVIGTVIGIFIGIALISSIIYFGWNFIASAYDLPVIKEYWHAFVGWLLFALIIKPLFKRGK